LSNKYIFGDCCAGIIWTVDNSTSFEIQVLFKTELNSRIFGEDEYGEPYVVDYRSAFYQILS